MSPPGPLSALDHFPSPALSTRPSARLIIRLGLGCNTPYRQFSTATVSPLGADRTNVCPSCVTACPGAQFSGEAACRQRLLRHASMRHMTHTALLLDGDWAEAGGADDAREACLVAALERAVPFGRAAGDGGGGAAVVPCQTAKLMWRTDGLLEL